MDDAIQNFWPVGGSMRVHEGPLGVNPPPVVSFVLLFIRRLLGDYRENNSAAHY